MKKLALAALAVSGLLANGSAFAAVYTCAQSLSVTNWTTADLTVDTLSGWQASTGGNCINQDKTYTFGSSNLPGASDISFSYLVDGFGDAHFFNLGSLATWGGGQLPFGIYTLSYTLTATDPAKVLTAADLNVNITGAGNNVNVNKTITPSSGPLISTGGATGLVTIPNATSVGVSMTINYQAGGLSNIQDTYYQGFGAVIPEIDALAGTGALTLLAGALALVGERRRRSA